MGVLGQSQQGQPNNDGELHNLQVTEAVFGTCLPIQIGTGRLHAKLLFYGGFNATPAPNSGKGVFGGKSQQFDYFADVLCALCAGPTFGLLNIWDQNGKLENLSGSFVFTVPAGGGSVSPVSAGQPPIQQDLGVSKSEAFSVTANDFGSPGPVTLTGTQQVVMTSVSGTPAAGEYNFDAATSTYSFSAADAGAEVTLSYSSVFSLYFFIATQGAEIPTSSPFQVSTDNEAFFEADEGVYFVDNGSAGIKVGGTPTATNQYSESSGVYTFFSGDAGRFVYIKYEYFSSDPDITNSSSLNITFFNGAQSQAPWSFMTSTFPGSNFGYSGICYVGANPMALGESASLPSYNYEVVGRSIFGGGNLDALPADAMELLLTDPLIGINFPPQWIGDWSNCRAYHASNGYFISDTLNTQQPIAQAMQRWLDAGNVAAVWSSGQLKLIPYGDTTTVGNGFTYTPPTTPAATLTWDDLQPWTDGKTGQLTHDDPLQVAQKAPQDCLNYVQAQWTNRENDYNNELTPEQNDAFIASFDFRPESPQTWDFITTQQAASFALNLRLKRNCYIRNGYKFKLAFWFSFLEPMDLVVLPTGENVRIIQVDDATDGMLTISAEQWSYGTANVTIYPKQASNSFQPNISQGIPGDTVPVFIQNTTTQSSGVLNKLQIAAIGQNANWGGCNVLTSLDGITYGQIGTINSRGVIGALSATLPIGVDPDTTDTLSVDLTLSQLGDPGAELVTVTQQQADNYVTLCAIVDQGGLTNELVSYETATLTGPARYNLSYLRRGVYATTIGAHSAGASFAFLGAGFEFLDFQYTPQYVGQSLFVKLQSFNLVGNQVQNLSQVPAFELFISAQGNQIESPSANLPSTNTVSTSGSGQIGTGDERNPNLAYDHDLDTGIFQICSGAGTTSITFSGFASGLSVGGMQLYVSYQTTTSAANEGASYNISYSLNSGSSFTVMRGATFTTGSTDPLDASGVAIVSIPAGTNLSDVQVQTQNAITLGITQMQIFEIWIQ